jgi:hypothetical protein
MNYEIRNDGFEFQGFYLGPYAIVDFFRMTLIFLMRFRSMSKPLNWDLIGKA